MSTPAELAPVLEAGGVGLSRLVHRTEIRLAEVAEGHGTDLGGHALSTLTAGGKRLRPLLVFLCADSGPPALPAAVAVELLHMATLVHDDVLDRAELRRGQATVFSVGGREAATATGDLLFSRAFAELAATESVEAVRVLSRASQGLVRGELMQRADAWSADVTPERYLERCRLKTAALFEAACRMGALLGGEPAAAEALGRFGERIGLAFQLLDDMLDVSGPSERTGKPRGADLLDGTVTLPLIIARRRDPALADLDVRQATIGPGRAAEVCDHIVTSGALGDVRAEALRHVAEAKAALTGLELPDSRRGALNLVADAVVDRYT